MRKFTLLTSVLLTAPFAMGNVSAQCVATQDCASLGYTETSCENGGIKCPFGNTWACPMSESEFCQKYGFDYVCSGTGYISGGGKACDNKYAFCTCADTYEWKDGKCSKIRPKCKVGWFYYSDNSCSDEVLSGKIPIGVVFYLNDNGIGGQALALQDVGQHYWSNVNSIDISTLKNYSSTQEALTDIASCDNTNKIIAACDESICPAAWAAKNYYPKNAPETKGNWCLPAYGAGDQMWNNFKTINSKLNEINATSLNSRFSWSSTEANSLEAYGWNYSTNTYGTSVKYGGGVGGCIRPVIEF